MVPVFEASFQRVLALNPGNVVKELPAVSDTTLGNGIGLAIVRIGNYRASTAAAIGAVAAEINPRRSAGVNNGPYKPQARHPVLARGYRVRGKNPAIKRKSRVVEEVRLDDPVELLMDRPRGDVLINPLSEVSRRAREIAASVKASALPQGGPCVGINGSGHVEIISKGLVN